MQTQTIELTSKRYKLAQLLGGTGVLLSVPVACIGHVADDGPVTAVSVASLFVGVSVYIYGRFGAWWNNG